MEMCKSIMLSVNLDVPPSMFGIIQVKTLIAYLVCCKYVMNSEAVEPHHRQDQHTIINVKLLA